MDIYLLSTILGAVGLGAMAASGVGQHTGGHHAGGHDSAGGHGFDAGHGHAGGHGMGGGHGHAGGHGHDAAGHAHDAGGHAHDVGGHAHAGHGHIGDAGMMWLLGTPRILFALLLGFGVTGLMLRGVIGGILLVGAAAVAGIAFERFVVRRLWNLAFRFESSPALTLESALDAEGVAVSNFDRDGHGLISLEIDGQVVQLLARLLPAERERDVKVRAGQRVRVEEVDTARNRCTVSVL